MSDEEEKKPGGHTLTDHLYGQNLAHEHDEYSDHDHDHFEFDDDGPIEQNPIWMQDHVTLVSVGIDIGSAGTQVIFSRINLRRYGEDRGINTEAWSPIAQGGVLDDPAITEIASRLERTAAQVVLRWHLQRGSIVFPKSTTPSRIEENFELFDFELEDADIQAIAALDKGEDGRTGPLQRIRRPIVPLDRRSDLCPGSLCVSAALRVSA